MGRIMSYDPIKVTMRRVHYNPHLSSLGPHVQAVNVRSNTCGTKMSRAGKLLLETQDEAWVSCLHCLLRLEQEHWINLPS
ncbi:hypothetical protein SEA_A3WALLY_354 [Microbacterium phage A3Wally]|nr:hypothetical protein SEA_A3WALLY_354 [Microbacterium phage A3Wally]